MNVFWTNIMKKESTERIWIFEHGQDRFLLARTGSTRTYGNEKYSPLGQHIVQK
jgi:hypothetical protein